MRQNQLFQKSIYSFSFLWIVVGSCAEDANNAVQVKSIYATDKRFSEMAQTKGMQAACLAYADTTSVVLLRDNHYPIEGEEVVHYFKTAYDTTRNLSWEVQGGAISEAADLGYSYGIWTLAAKDTTLQGTYVTIWRKAKNGDWKFVLDTGNSGLGKK